jgi:hypothetical protein
MKKTLLALGLAAAMMPFAFAQQAPAANSGANTTQAAKKTKKTKKTKKNAATKATPSK